MQRLDAIVTNAFQEVRDLIKEQFSVSKTKQRQSLIYSDISDSSVNCYRYIA